jgi:hypothetical protein
MKRGDTIASMVGTHQEVRPIGSTILEEAAAIVGAKVVEAVQCNDARNL